MTTTLTNITNCTYHRRGVDMTPSQRERSDHVLSGSDAKCVSARQTRDRRKFGTSRRRDVESVFLSRGFPSRAARRGAESARSLASRDSENARRSLDIKSLRVVVPSTVVVSSFQKKHPGVHDRVPRRDPPRGGATASARGGARPAVAGTERRLFSRKYQ